MTSASVVVAGYGNPLRGDDGVGWHVVQRLTANWHGNHTFLIGHHPLPEWAAALAEARVAYFVDCATSGPTRISRLRPGAGMPSVSLHDLTPRGLLGLTRCVYGRAPDSYLVAVRGETLAYGEVLSPRAMASVDEAVSLLDRHCERLNRKSSPLAIERE